MVNGLETFRDYFQNHSADYVLIGGVACELALNSLRLEFRPTDDFDIVIVSENLNQGFGEALKKFIQEGKYSVKRRQSNNKPSFFCFLSPQNDDFPSKLELATVNHMMNGNGILLLWMPEMQNPVCLPSCLKEIFMVLFWITKLIQMAFQQCVWKD